MGQRGLLIVMCDLSNRSVVGVLLFMLVACAQANAQSLSATLIRTTDTFNWTIPSPDPSAVVYVPGANALFIADSEVNETALFSGSNVFHTDMNGGLLESFSTLAFTDEPAGLTVNPANGNLFISTDNSPRGIYEIDSGADGVFRTADDIISFFNSTDFGSQDPEGLTYNPLDGRLYIVDGEANLVYVVDPGANGFFDGVAPSGDDSVVEFSTANLGIVDPEGIAYDALSDGLYIIGEPEDQLLHMSTSGELIRLVALDSQLLRKPAGLALAPSSLGNGGQSLFLVDRGVDNDSDPDENDGRLFEFALPPMAGNEAPVVSITAPVGGQGVAPNTRLSFSGVAIDTEDGDLSAELVWQSDLDGRIGTGAAFSTSRLSPGLHEITASAVDSMQAQSFMSVTLRIFPAGRVIVERRIASSADDAEERGLTGNIWLSSSDLELSQDKQVEQTVGLRFNALQIPTGAVIEEAFIQFEAEKSETQFVNLEIRAQASDTAEPIIRQENNLRNRATTGAASLWQPAGWATVGEASTAQKSADLTAVVQEVVDRAGWSAGNSMAFIITGSGPGRRTAVSFDDDPDSAPLLYVQYREIAPAPELAIVSPADGESFGSGVPVVFSAIANDVQDGDLSESIVWESSLDGPIGTGESITTANLTAGVQLLTSTVVNSAGRATTTGVSVVIEAPPNDAPSLSITSPFNGFQTLIGAPVNLTATAVDAEDGDLADLVFWVSDLDGNLGSGAAVSAGTLSVGTHQITASVADSSGVSSDATISVTVRSPVNTAPLLTIAAPTDALEIDVDTEIRLVASARDSEDGNLSGAVSWSSDLDGPLGSGSPSVLLSEGLHTLSASVTDSGNLPASASVTVQVGPVGSQDVTLSVRVNSPSDDAEERGERGRIVLDSRDLEMAIDRERANAVGMRFTNVQIPKDAGIISAFIQFQVDEPTSDLAFLDITVQEDDDPTTFTTNRFDISLRPRSALSIDWLPSRWLAAGDADIAQQTTDLSPLVQRIVNRDNWSPGNAMAFLVNGDGTRTAESFNGDTDGAPQLIVTYTLDNLAPVVSTSNDLSVMLGESALISGTVDDDGRPADTGILTTEWVVTDGPGIATIDDQASLSTSVSFDAVGTYTLLLKASDGQLSAYDELTITVAPSPENLAPAVSAGPDLRATIGETVFLSGTVSDDGLPGTGVVENISWVQLSGPADAALGSAGSPGTVAQFSQPGVYAFELSAFDGELPASDRVVVNVVDTSGNVNLVIPIVDGDDDAEETASGSVRLSSSDLELVESSSEQLVGMRFRTLAVPPGATITNAYVQFTVDERDSESTRLTIQAERSDNSAAFTTAARSLTARPLTQSLVNWVPVAWDIAGESSDRQATPDLSAVVQEVIDRPGWREGNDLSIFISGSGTRTAEAYDGEPDAAPRLFIEFQIGE